MKLDAKRTYFQAKASMTNMRGGHSTVTEILEEMMLQPFGFITEDDQRKRIFQQLLISEETFAADSFR